MEFATTRVVIDSRDRDTRHYPSVSSYVVTLDEEIHDVVGLKVLTADVPFSSYVVGYGRNDRIPFKYVDDGVERVAILRRGDYTPDELATEVERALNAVAAVVGTNRTFIVRYRPRLDSYAFFCEVPFLLAFHVSGVDGSTTLEERLSSARAGGNRRNEFAPGTAARLLGFSATNEASASFGDAVTTALGSGEDTTPPQDVSSAFVSNTVISRYRRNFDACRRYVVLNIDPAFVNVSTNNALNKSFALLPSKSTDLSVPPERGAEKSFRPPVPKFGKIKVSLTDYDGKPYDFQNHEHRIELEFKSIRQKKYYGQLEMKHMLV